VHAGTKETFGLVILEAMACGRPIVATRAGAIPEIVDHRIGMLAEPANAASMAEAIAGLYERDIEAVGAAARERVLQRFTWARSFQSQMNAYANLSAQQARRATADSRLLPHRPGRRLADAEDLNPAA
jgi:alpha-1,6-mannosyltransferase